MAHQFEDRAGVLIVRMTSPVLDFDAAQALLTETTDRLAATPDRNVVLDLAQVARLDSSAINSLIFLSSDVRSRRRRLYLANAAQVHAALSNPILAEVLPVFEDEAAALAAHAARAPDPLPDMSGRTHLMRFVPGHHGALDRLGGLPTHLPSAFPSYEFREEPPKKKRNRKAEEMPLQTKEYAFTAQFYCDPERLPVPNALCVQVYLCEPGSAPWPEVAVVPLGAPENVEGRGRINHEIVPHDIEWVERAEPAAVSPDPFDPTNRPLMESKARGATFFNEDLEPDDLFLFQVRDDRTSTEHGLNLGGYSLVVALRPDGQLKVYTA